VRGVSGTSSLVFPLNSGRVTEPPPGTGPLVWNSSGALVRLAGEASQFYLQTPDRRSTVAVDSGGTVWKAWDTSRDPPAPGPVFRMDPTRDVPPIPALSPDGKKIARISGPGVVDVWDIFTGRIVEHFTAVGAAQIEELAWREKLTAVDWLRGAVRLWVEQ
jgi:hypothetical protein